MFKALSVASLILMSSVTLSQEVFLPEPESNQVLAAGALRTYCQDCHGLGNLRFIRGETHEDQWDFLLQAKAPESKRLWAEQIIKVLSWPDGHEYPDFRNVMDPPSKDWMPRGFKRIEFANSKIQDRPSREVIIEELIKSLEHTGQIP
jgi:hypothetical protein